MSPTYLFYWKIVRQSFLADMNGSSFAKAAYLKRKILSATQFANNFILSLMKFGPYDP